MDDDRATQGLTHALAQEAGGLLDQGPTTVLVPIVLCTVLLWVLQRLEKRLGRVRAALAHQRHRQVVRASRVLSVVVVLSTALAITRGAGHLAPTWVLGVLLFVFLPAVLVSSGVLHDLWGALIAQLRLGLCEGEFVAIGDAQGVLTHVGLLHLGLRDARGHVHRIPCRILSSSPVRRAPSPRSIPLELELGCPTRLTAEQLERIRRSALMSPYRVPGTPVVVQVASSADRVLVSTFVWSQAALDPARRRLERSIARLAE
jgi:hypothetical protein